MPVLILNSKEKERGGLRRTEDRGQKRKGVTFLGGFSQALT
jgi:hypothetical protein